VLGVLRPYSYFSAGTCPTNKKRSEKMFYGDYSYELAKERMETSIKAHEHDRLVKVVKELRLAREGSRSGVVARSSALVMTLFR
jgi:hypothetical protein